MKKYKKFEKGYLTYRKNKLFLNVALNVLSAVIIFIAGLLLNKMQPRNIFSVLALLFVLPVGRSLATYFILLPYKEIKGGHLFRVEENIKDKGILLYSPVFTSAENVMHLDLIAVFKGRILGYKEKSGKSVRNEYDYKKKTDAAKAYIDKHLKNQGRGDNIVVFDDLDKFIKAFPENKISEEEMAEIKGFVESMEYFVV
ncbi:MAG: hypothetical protein ACTTKP_00835 [Catonella sp.]|uniref:hypothetical protein n=1 Tax=Catonella sp. TaxID=2382125 RepID=UPI003FA00BAD